MPRSSAAGRASAGRAGRGDPAERGGAHQNVTRTALLLAALAEGGAQGLRLSEVGRATGLGKATVHRLLTGLVAHGLAELDDGRFFLGQRVVALAAGAADRHGLVRRAGPLLAAIAQRFEDTVHLSLRSGASAVCVARCEGVFPIKARSPAVGEGRPLGVGADGLAILAALPADEQDRMLAAGRAERAQLGVDEPTLRVQLARAARDGFAGDDPGAVPAAGALAVPLPGPLGVVGALCVAAIAERLAPPRRDAIVAALRDAAAALARSTTEGSVHADER